MHREIFFIVFEEDYANFPGIAEKIRNNSEIHTNCADEFGAKVSIKADRLAYSVPFKNDE